MLKQAAQRHINELNMGSFEEVSFKLLFKRMSVSLKTKGSASRLCYSNYGNNK